MRIAGKATKKDRGWGWGWEGASDSGGKTVKFTQEEGAEKVTASHPLSRECFHSACLPISFLVYDSSLGA